MERQAKIYIAGHSGLIGQALIRQLKALGYSRLLARSHKELDLKRQQDVEEFFRKEQPEYVILAAARVGGIGANSSYPAEFIYENLMIQANIIHSAYTSGVKKLLFFGSACMYPRECAQPMKEDSLLTGYLEPTSEPYAIAKIAGVKMCEAYNRQYSTKFICAIPSNIYGPYDHFGSQDSHVVASLIDKFHKAKFGNIPSVSVWGTGRPRRDFIFVDDVASAALFLINNYESSDFINIGVGVDAGIKDLAEIIKKVVGYEGRINFDLSKPDGIPQKLLDNSRLNSLGWAAKISLEEGIKKTYAWYQGRFKRTKDKLEAASQ